MELTVTSTTVTLIRYFTRNKYRLARLDLPIQKICLEIFIARIICGTCMIEEQRTTILVMVVPFWVTVRHIDK